MNIIEAKKKESKTRIIVISLILALAFILLVIVLYMENKSAKEQRELLADSIKNQLTSITLAARDLIDPQVIENYNSLEDLEEDEDTFISMRDDLRKLAKSTGADYIYIIKYVDGECMFIVDTDEEDETVFIPYEPSQVHLDAFEGKTSSGVMNVVDEYGSYNTAAIPLYNGTRLVGVVSTDIEDRYYAESIQRTKTTLTILIVVLLVVLSTMIGLIIFLLKRVNKMQDQLRILAHHDTVTGLPNRQYLLDILEEKTKNHAYLPFALVFVDLDNFKNINDTAGHDMGDEVLYRIGEFLDSDRKSVHAFRPAAGQINVAARVGGDEFIQIVDKIGTPDQAVAYANTLLDNFKSGPFEEYRSKYGLGLSIGISLYPIHTSNFHVLIKYADIAMYHAKHGGKNDFRIYDEAMKPKNEK